VVPIEGRAWPDASVTDLPLGGKQTRSGDGKKGKKNWTSGCRRKKKRRVVKSEGPGDESVGQQLFVLEEPPRKNGGDVGSRGLQQWVDQPYVMHVEGAQNRLPIRLKATKGGDPLVSGALRHSIQPRHTGQSHSKRLTRRNKTGGGGRKYRQRNTE